MYKIGDKVNCLFHYHEIPKGKFHESTIVKYKLDKGIIFKNNQGHILVKSVDDFPFQKVYRDNKNKAVREIIHRKCIASLEMI